MRDSFPYSIPEQGGFHIWGDCGGNLTVNPGNKSSHEADWKFLQNNVDYIRSKAAASQPFFVYQGFNIVHPPYLGYLLATKPCSTPFYPGYLC